MTSREKIDLIARTDPFELIAEIERLRAENEHFKLVDYYNGRNAVIEECAMVAERYLQDRKREYEGTAAAIRALKDKRP